MYLFYGLDSIFEGLESQGFRSGQAASVWMDAIELSRDAEDNTYISFLGVAKSLRILNRQSIEKQILGALSPFIVIEEIDRALPNVPQDGCTVSCQLFMTVVSKTNETSCRIVAYQLQPQQTQSPWLFRQRDRRNEVTQETVDVWM